MIRESRQQRDAASTTLMLIVVIAVFLATEIPLMVITVLHTLSNRCVHHLFFYSGKTPEYEHGIYRPVNNYIPTGNLTA